MNIGGGGGGGDGSGLPWRAGAPAGVFAYGCPPFEPAPIPDLGPGYVPPPLVPPNFDWSKLRPEGAALAPCPKCSNHHRVLEPCPFCLRAELDALKKALGQDAKPAEEIAMLRATLSKVVFALKEVQVATGSERLAQLVAEAEKVLAT